MTTEVERLEAELKLAKLGAKFRAAKEDGTATPKLRTELREAREDFRENHRQGGPGTVQPGTIAASAEAKAL